MMTVQVGYLCLQRKSGAKLHKKETKDKNINKMSFKIVTE